MATPGVAGSLALLAPEAQPLAVARLQPVDCSSAAPETKEIVITTEIHSDFGVRNATLTLVTAGNTEAVRATIENFRLNFVTATPQKSALIAAACAAAGKSELTLTQQQLVELREWTLLVGPDCKVLQSVNGGFECLLPTLDATAAKTELTEIQTTMIRKWSRQPYLLARRLAIGLSLAQALESEKPDQALDTLCKVVKSSLAVELPATLSSKRWQATVCERAPGDRRRAAAFGLAKVVKEIDFLKQLFERTSKLGFLSVRVPPSAVPNKEILVSLTPESDVADNVTKETARLWSGVGQQDGELPRSCWHPVFGESPELLRLSRQLTMAGEAARVACAEMPQDKNKSTLAVDSERYFAESITSETEFVITNGRAKTLRLPAGSYKYTLRGLPENPDEWDDASQVTAKAEGQIVWEAQRPRPVITTW